MTLLFALILFFALLAAGIDFFYLGRIVIKSLSILALTVLTGILICVCAYFGNMHDTDILNGKITSKAQVWVPCSHSYSCNCSTDSKGNTTCQTCFLHSNDYDWDVRSTIGTFTINRVDLQGADEPSRFTKVKIGESASRTENIINYMKASKESLFSAKETEEDTRKFGKFLPDYPEPYDYYRFNRVLASNYPESNQLSDSLSDILQTLGAEKQVNILVVVVPTADKTYKSALERHWKGGKKNDVVVVIGASHYPNIDWADGFSYANSMDNSMLFVQLREDIKQVETLKNVSVLSSVIAKDIVSTYKRHPMKNFQYLSYDYVPSGLTLWFCSIVFLLMTVGIVCTANYIHDN